MEREDVSCRGKTKRVQGVVGGGMRQRKEEKFSLCSGSVLRICVRAPFSGAAD